MSKPKKKVTPGVPVVAPKPDAPAPASLPVEPLAPVEYDFRFLPDEPPHRVDERALHALIKDWRHGRATRSLGQVLTDSYATLFSLVLLGAMVVNLLRNVEASAAGCMTQGCQVSRLLLPWTLLLVVASLALAAARLFGPVLASAAEGFWLMEAPISRSRLLAPRLVGAVAMAFGVAAPVAALVTLLAGVGWLGVLVWALATGATASGLVAWAALEQTAERRWPLKVVQVVLSTAAAALVGWMVMATVGTAGLPSATAWTAAPWPVAALAAALTVGLAVWAGRRLNRIRRARLVSGGSLVAGMQGAMFALDLGLARDILVDRQALERGFVKPTRGRGVGVQALVWRDAQRLLRFPRPLLGLAGAALVPYAAAALGLHFLMPFIAALSLTFALVPFLGSLRVLTRTGALARAFPFTPRQLRNASVIVPSVLAALWVVVTMPAMTQFVLDPLKIADAAMVAVVVGMAGILGAVRWQTAKAVDFNAPMMATNAGALPPSLIFNLIRGLDMCVLVTAPLIFGLPAWVSLIIAAFLYSLVGLDLEQIKADADAAQREAAQAKAERQGSNPKVGTKIKVTRPQR